MPTPEQPKLQPHVLRTRPRLLLVGATNEVLADFFGVIRAIQDWIGTTGGDGGALAG